MEHKFKVGDVVRLKSADIELTVKGYFLVMKNGSNEMIETNQVICKYFSKEENKFREMTEPEDIFDKIR